MQQNILLTPKWKERTYNTHKKHLKLYRNGKFKVAFLGDSMMERWLSTGVSFWKSSFSDCANIGVGGDGIEHLLYRLTENTELKGILDVITVDKIMLMIGTNNLHNKTPEQILGGIVNIMTVIFQKQPNVELIVYGLLDRTDLPDDKREEIDELNTKLQNHIEQTNNSKLSYRYFGDKINEADKYFDDDVHLSTLGYNIWYEDLKQLLNPPSNV